MNTDKPTAPEDNSMKASPEHERKFRDTYRLRDDLADSLYWQCAYEHAATHKLWPDEINAIGGALVRRESKNTQPTATEQATPRTDEEQARDWPMQQGAVSADFARTLERELAAKDREIERRKAQLDMWTSAAMHGNAAIAQQAARAERAEAELARIKAIGPVSGASEADVYQWLRDAQAERDALRAEVERLGENLAAIETAGGDEGASARMAMETVRIRAHIAG